MLVKLFGFDWHVVGDPQEVSPALLALMVLVNSVLLAVMSALFSFIFKFVKSRCKLRQSHENGNSVL